MRRDGAQIDWHPRLSKKPRPTQVFDIETKVVLELCTANVRAECDLREVHESLKGSHRNFRVLGAMQEVEES